MLSPLLPPAAHPGVSGFPVSWSSGNSGIFNYQPGTLAGRWGQRCPVTPARRWSPREQAQKRLVTERGSGAAGQAGPAWLEQVVRGPAASGEPWGGSVPSLAETWGSGLLCVPPCPPPAPPQGVKGLTEVVSEGVLG